MRQNLAPCVVSGCPELTRETRCALHTRTYDAEHRGDFRDVYRSRRWKGLRRQVIQEHPFCQEPGCTRPTTDVDHVIPMREGGEPYDRANLQALCHAHHSGKTAREVWHGQRED